VTARWVVYQQERFPLARHAPLVLVTALCTLCFTNAVQGAPRFPAMGAWLGSSFVALGLFFQLRVLDEFKDFEDDRAHRPYRAVPRGLVRLQELAVVGVVVGALQLALTLLAAPRALLPLLVCWAFMGLMAAEFFSSAWLKARPLVYMLSHAPVTGLIQLVSSAWVWLNGLPLEVIGLAVCASVAGMALEIGRKLRAPADEEPGVDTYTAVWGLEPAVRAWWTVGAATAALTFLLNPSWLTVLVMLALLALGVSAGQRFLRAPSSRSAKPFELVSALWALGAFGMLALKGAV
jgi:4-hydroxybenzoate polyprenyltransferase